MYFFIICHFPFEFYLFFFMQWPFPTSFKRPGTGATKSKTGLKPAFQRMPLAIRDAVDRQNRCRNLGGKKYQQISEPWFPCPKSKINSQFFNPKQNRTYAIYAFQTKKKTHTHLKRIRPRGRPWYSSPPSTCHVMRPGDPSPRHH